MPKRQQKPVSKKQRQWLIFKAEMLPFWIFVATSTAIVLAAFIYLPIIQALVSAGTLLVIVLITFFVNLSITKKSLISKSASNRFKEITNTLHDGVIVYDQDFVVLVFNPSAEQIFGLSSEEVVGKKLTPGLAANEKYSLLIQTVFPSLAPLVIPRSSEGEYPQIIDISFSEPDVALRVMTTPMPSDQMPGFIKVITDRTREVEAYKSRTEFITVAAHQLRTPVTTTYWALDLIRKDATLTGETKEIAREGYLAAHNLTKIVNDLLDVAKIEEGKFGYEFKENNIVAFMKEIVNNAYPVAKSAGVEMYFDPGEEETIMINIDTNKLAMAISNLLDNAIKYNVKNGSVTIRINRAPDKPYVQITVADTGIGIPPEDLSQTFEKFFRAENALKIRTEGSGLGLYIVKNIIESHGGKISVDSTLNRGTIFTILLPTDFNLVPKKESPFGI